MFNRMLCKYLARLLCLNYHIFLERFLDQSFFHKNYWIVRYWLRGTHWCFCQSRGLVSRRDATYFAANECTLLSVKNRLQAKDTREIYEFIKTDNLLSSVSSLIRTDFKLNNCTWHFFTLEIEFTRASPAFHNLYKMCIWNKYCA